MTKDMMIAQMSAQSGISKKQAADALQAFVNGVTTQLKKGQKVSFAGFGTFTISKRKARLGRNPQTGTPMQIPATRVPVFRAGKHLKEAVRK
ncbi:MAG TPA: HU family DNA-binding protein [Candidatus Deferrimicrobium sp.]|nr:HU family DNA-binding protein [Candidatus Deferrimicrobium sp.]